MVTYQNLLTVPVVPTHEKVVRLKQADIPNGYMPQMIEQKRTLGPGIIVRNEVRTRLQRVQQRVRLTYPDLELYVTFGYRTLEFQTQRFKEQLCAVVTDEWTADPLALFETVHRRIAVPTVAGHPTGGAIDVLLRNRRNTMAIPFGSDMYDYSTKRCYAFSPDISAAETKNRSILRTLLMNEGFAPFDGEWWHFSYGDREWACYYRRPYAIYEQLTRQEVLEMLR